MTICNMSIEGGARVGYVNPDQTTFDYLAGRPFAPQATRSTRRVAWWRAMASDADASYDDRVRLDAARRSSRRSPGGSTPAVGRRRAADSVAADVRAARGPRIEEALDFMGFDGGAPIAGTPHRRRVRRLLHQRAAVRSARSRARRARPPRGRRTSGRWSCRDRRRSARPPSAKASHASSPRPASNGASAGLLDVPRDESRIASKAARSARRRRTATSRAVRAVRPAARCS